MKKFRVIVTVIVITAFSVTLALLSKKIFTDKAEDEKLKNLITTEEPSGTGQNVTGSSVFQRNADYLNELSQQNSDCIGYTQICLSPDSSKYLFLNEHPDFARIVTLLNKYEIAGKVVPDDLLSKYTENKYLLQILQANYDGRFNSNFITMYLEDNSTLADRIANDLQNNVLDWSLVNQLGGNYFVPRIIASLEELYLDTIVVRKIATENTEMQRCLMKKLQ